MDAMARLQHRNWLKSLFNAMCFIWILVELQETGSSLYAETPPRGWNSYDSFSWIINEKEFLDNAKVVSLQLRPYGYQYVVVDYLWYRKFETGAYTNSLGFDVIDEWGRLNPDPKRWPSSQNGKGFRIVAEAVHGMGLKFGIHVMRGISTQAYHANTPIMGPNGQPYREMGRIWRARDIALPSQRCAWMSQGFMSVDMRLGASRAFLKSLYQQYADWGVDFVKHDCVFGDDLNINEITAVSEILKEMKHPIMYSISPGTNVTVDLATRVHGLVNMYRVTADDWDTWKDVESHFKIASEVAMHGLIGAEGLLGKSWPDLDMLPFGKLSSVGANQGPFRTSKLSFEEQKSQMTLWAMAKSPLFFGGDLRTIDEQTLKLITHPTVLDINANSVSNTAFPFIRSIPSMRTNETTVLGLSNSCHKKDLECSSMARREIKAYSWIAKNPRNGDIYLAFFNSDDIPAIIYTRVSNVIGIMMEPNYVNKHKSGVLQYAVQSVQCKCLEVWSQQSMKLIAKSTKSKQVETGVTYLCS